MKTSSRLTANAYVIRSLVFKDRNTDVFMPECFLHARFSLHLCLIGA